MQELRRKRPIYVATDVDQTLSPEGASPFLKDYRVGYNKNEQLPTGTAGDGAMGGNFGSGTPLQGSRQGMERSMLPAGKNQNIGTYECQETNELYICNWNSEGQHGIYRIDGFTQRVDRIKVDPCFNFSLDPAHNMKNRMFLKVVYGRDASNNRTPMAKYLMITDGLNWQRWIDVETAIATNGFDPVAHPYFLAPPPLRDQCTLINWAVEPPFQCPGTEIIPFRPTDAGKNNNIAHRSLQFAYQYLYRDGRASVLSPYSGNVYVTTGGCQELTTNQPRCVRLQMEAGGPFVEQIRIFFRNCNGDWYIYETLDKYDLCAADQPFWERQVALPGYDQDANTFSYEFCGDKECGIFNQEDANRVQNDLPIQSYALWPVGDTVMLANNLYGYDNYKCDVLDQVAIEVVAPGSDDPDATPDCEPRLVRISAYATITGAPLVRKEKDGPIFFMYNWPPFPQIDESLDQITNGQGIPGYLAGTPFGTYGTQMAVDKDGNMEEVGIIDLFNDGAAVAIGNWMGNGGYYVIKYDFVVPPGVYLFRQASGLSSLDDPDYQQTSHYVGFSGRIDRMEVRRFVPGFWQDTELRFVPTAQDGDGKNFRSKELYIEACAGDVDTFADMGKYVLGWNPPYLIGIANEKAVQGYVRTTSDPTNSKPVELLQYVPNEGFPETIIHGVWTDHNGFYFGRSQRGGARNMNIAFTGQFNCSVYEFMRTNLGRRPPGQRLFKVDLYLENVRTPYQLNNEVHVKGSVKDQSGAGIPGVAVTITNGSTALTNAMGEFTVRVSRSPLRNGLHPGLENKILINSLGGCQIANADCSCMVPLDYDQTSLPCIPNTNEPAIYPVRFDQVIRFLAGGGQRGLKGGGRYGFAIVGRDAAGRNTFANNFQYVDIPTFLETGKVAPVSLRWSVTTDFLLPPETRSVSFYRTRNLNFGSYLQWVGDKIEFINARGETSTGTDEAVRARVIIQSLLDFNRQNNFATTVGYQFVQGDILRIYDDGAGKLFRVDAATPFMDYPILGNTYNESVDPANQADDADDIVASFIIPYDNRLDALKDSCGFWIEIIRPHACEGRELYYEVCKTYPVQNGRILGDVTSGMIDTWDTYYQSRLIRPKDCTAQQTAHPYESSSITDYWGANCENLGRVAVADPQARQQWYGDDVIKSDDFSNEGRVNGLGTFREANRKNFRGQEWGAIIAGHAERNVVCFICQNDWFLTDFNMNYIRAGRDGLVVANLENALSEPHQKTGKNYGCEYEDNAAITFDNGIVIWADRKNANVVLMDYRDADDIARIDNKGYFVSKFRHVIAHNAALSADQYLAELIELSAERDPKYNEYILTFRRRRGLSENPVAFTNVERETFIDESETFVFNLDLGRWVRFTGYTPESYGVLRHSTSGLELVAFANGIPYFLNSNSVSYFNYFFGVATDQVITFIENFDPSKVKIGQGITVESNELQYYVDMIYTDSRNSFSYIPKGYWVKREGIWYSEFLRDMSTYPDANHPVTSMLVDGKRIFGLFFWVRLVRDTTYRTAYNEINNCWIRFSGSERSEK